MRPEEVRAAVRESADLGQWLGNKVHRLFSSPLEIVAFSDEEGVRCGITLKACSSNSSALLWRPMMQSPASLDSSSPVALHPLSLLLSQAPFLLNPSYTLSSGHV